MMKKVLTLFCATVLIATTVVFAETLSNDSAAKNLATKVMIKVAANDLDAALKILKPYSSISSAEIDSIAIQSKALREQSRQRYGAPIGYEFIDSKKVGNSLLRLRYIEKTEKTVLLWIFNFYKVKESWILNSFYWNEDYKPLFNEE
jgi:hypothetical protein